MFELLESYLLNNDDCSSILLNTYLFKKRGEKYEKYIQTHQSKTNWQCHGKNKKDHTTNNMILVVYEIQYRNLKTEQHEKRGVISCAIEE